MSKIKKVLAMLLTLALVLGMGDHYLRGSGRR